MTIDATVLIVPGLREHVPEHWQTLLAARLPKVHTVPPLEEDKLSCAARVEALDRALRAIDGPVILVAHSAGVMMVAHWAQASRSPRPIKGALLATPADVENPFPAGYPTHGHAARTRLAADSAPSAAVPEPARGEPQRSAVRVRARAGAGARLGQRTGGSRPGRPPQSGRGLRRVAAGAGTDRQLDR